MFHPNDRLHAIDQPRQLEMLASATQPGSRFIMAKQQLRTFEELIAEADAVPVAGWDFSWLDGRASEERPSWGYQRLLRERLGMVTSALDIQTGGGEVLAGAGPFPPSMVATESWPPNLALATRMLHPLGVVVVACTERPLPFADKAFDLVTSRHPVDLWWDEIARVLKPGGVYTGRSKPTGRSSLKPPGC